MRESAPNRTSGSTAPGSVQHGWLLYDGSCGVCSRGVAFWQSTLERHGFGIAALQEEWVRERLDVSDDDLLSNVRLLLRNGHHIAGADVYRYILRHIWWAYPVWVLSIVPGIRGLFNWGYRRFAARRHHISRVCKIDAVAP